MRHGSWQPGLRGVASGCLGTCSYSFLSRDRYWMGLIHLLAAFADDDSLLGRSFDDGQRIEIAQRSEYRVDIAIVGNVIAEIEHR